MNAGLTELLIVSVFLYLVAPWLAVLVIVVSLLQLFVNKTPEKEPVVIGS